MKLSIMRSWRRRSNKNLFFIPCIFTFGNALLGFISIVKVLEGNYSVAAYCIIAAAFMDMLDGRLARALGTTTEFGMELDSLCDAVSFCLAPTILMYGWRLHEISIVGTAALMFYVCAGLYRLAKFNCQKNQHHYFSGLPTPSAALTLAGFVIYAPFLQEGPLAWILNAHVVMLLMIILASLMISTIPFLSFKQFPIKQGRVGIIYLGMALLLIVCMQQGYPLLLLMLLVYISCSLILYVLRLLMRPTMLT